MSAPARLSGPQKAALVVLGLDEVVAADVLRQLDEAALRKLAIAVESLDPVPVDALDPAFEEFTRRVRDPVPPRGGADYLRKLTVSALGDDRARRMFEKARGEGPRPLDAIRQARAQTLAELLLEEHPQVAAVVMSQLGREQAARVLCAMPAERQADLLARIGSLGEIPAQAVEAASEALLHALEAAGGLADEGDRSTFDGIAFAASVLNEMPPTDSEKVLEALDGAEEKLAPKIREAMFTFEDLGRIEARALQVLMREVQADQLLIALKQASEGLREHFLSAVSSRAAEQMREDLSLMPPTRLSDIERAQREIVESAMRLAADGRLVLPGGGSAEKMV